MEIALVVVGVAAIVGLFLAVVAFRGRKPTPGETPLVVPAAPVHAAPAPTPPLAERARPGLAGRIRSVLRGQRPGEDEWRELEEALIQADVGPRASADLVSRLRERYSPELDPAAMVTEEIAAILGNHGDLALPHGDVGVVMVVGVNGTGKTTTIGKLAHMLRRTGRSVCLANSDTFRAAATEQLETWAERAGAQLVAQARGADPGAVAFDAVQAAKARGSDVLIVDTAGRLHTRTPLMDELRKVKRVLEKAAGDVEEVLLVLDATTGQNGIAQARAFTHAVDVTGVVLTKMDGTAAGGIVLAVREELGVPVKLIGTGEGIEDLEPFDPWAFAGRLVGA